MKKLLITASTFPRWEGDSEPRFVLDLAKGLTKYYEVTVLVPWAKGAKEKEILDGVEVIRYHYFPVHSWETLCYPGAIVPRIKEKKIRILQVPFLLISLWFHLFQMLPDYDFVHAHWLIPQGIVQSFFKKKYFVTGHGGDVTSLNAGAIKALKQRCIKKASGVTAVSGHLKEGILRIASPDRLDVISMGCDVEAFGQQYRVENYFGQGDKKVVLFVGRLAEKKGARYLIDAMKQNSEFLVIAGNGPLKDELEKRAEELHGRVLFLGAKNHEELRAIYASADIFVAPSVTAQDGDQEGLGLVILEAMASGLPVVASRSGGIGDVIQNGVNGLLCEEKNSDELAAAIDRILSDCDLRKKLICNTQKSIGQWSFSNIAKRYYEFFEDCY